MQETNFLMHDRKGYQYWLKNQIKSKPFADPQIRNK
jgi:hypothetical protein